MVQNMADKLKGLLTQSSSYIVVLKCECIVTVQQNLMQLLQSLEFFIFKILFGSYDLHRA